MADQKEKAVQLSDASGKASPPSAVGYLSGVSENLTFVCNQAADQKEIKISVKLDYPVKTAVINIGGAANIGQLRAQIAKALEIEAKTHGFTAGSFSLSVFVHIFVCSVIWH